MGFDWIVLAAFAGYLALMLGIGFAFSRRQESLGDYYLGGRKMNKWVVALSAQASDMSGWLLMGLPGTIFVSGYSEAWIGFGLLVGTYLNWKIVARRLRKYSSLRLLGHQSFAQSPTLSKSLRFFMPACSRARSSSCLKMPSSVSTRH